MLARLEAHTIRKADIGHHTVKNSRCILLYNRRRGAGEDGAARGVIEMAVTVDQSGDRLAKALGHLGLNPGGGVFVDGVGEHDALVGHGKDRIMKFVLEAIDVTRNLGD